MTDIDPVAFGKMQGEIEALRRRIDDFQNIVDRRFEDSKKQSEEMAEDIKSIMEKLNQVKGGWFAIATLGSLAAAIGAWVWEVFRYWVHK